VDLDGGIGLAGSRGPGTLRRFSHEAMNTVFEVHVANAEPRYAAEAAQAAFAATFRGPRAQFWSRMTMTGLTLGGYALARGSRRHMG